MEAYSESLTVKEILKKNSSFYLEKMVVYNAIVNIMCAGDNMPTINQIFLLLRFLETTPDAMSSAMVSMAKGKTVVSPVR